MHLFQKEFSQPSRKNKHSQSKEISIAKTTMSKNIGYCFVFPWGEWRGSCLTSIQLNKVIQLQVTYLINKK